MNGCYYNDEIKVGEYVRTKTGNITKIIAIKDTLVWTDDFIDVHCRYNEGIVEKMDIAKHSFNIIDLIEVGDYVNGRKVQKVFIDPFVRKKRLEIEGTEINWQGDMSTIYCEAEDIKSIVTHEQFEQIKYIVKN